MATIIIPDITIHIYSDEVKETADYTVSKVNSKYLLENLPVGTYWYKFVGTYNGTPIAEEYKSFTVYDDSIINWRGTRLDKVTDDPQDFDVDVFLGIDTLTVSLTHEDAAYTGGKVLVGKDLQRQASREAIESGTIPGDYELSNVIAKDNVKIRAIPKDADTEIEEESGFYKVDGNNKTIAIELFTYFYFTIYLHTNSGYNITTNEAILKQNNTVVATLFKQNNKLVTSNKIKKGTYDLYIPASDIDENIRFKAVQDIIDIDSDNSEHMVWLTTELIPDIDNGDTSETTDDNPVNNL